jgi:hypothetical protein
MKSVLLKDLLGQLENIEEMIYPISSMQIQKITIF